MSIVDQKRITIADASGEDHDYVINPIPASKALDLLAELSEFIAGPLGAASHLFPKLQAVAALERQSATRELTREELASISAVSSELSSVLISAVRGIGSGIIRKGGTKKISDRLLAKVSRDGNVYGDINYKFDVYTRNYGEFLKIVQEVVMYNFSSFTSGLPQMPTIQAAL